MILFGRELSLEQMVGLVECNATPDEDLAHRFISILSTSIFQ